MSDLHYVSVAYLLTRGQWPYGSCSQNGNESWICEIGIGPTLAHGTVVFRKVISNSTQPLLCERTKVRHLRLRQNWSIIHWVALLATNNLGIQSFLSIFRCYIGSKSKNRPFFTRALPWIHQVCIWNDTVNSTLNFAWYIFSGGRHEAKKHFDLVKIYFLPKMLEMIHETDVHKLILLSNPPFHQKSRI